MKKNKPAARFFIRQLLPGRCAHQISQSQNHQLAYIHPDTRLRQSAGLLLPKLTISDQIRGV